MAGKTIGSLWRAKEGSKAALTGTVNILGVDVRVAIFKNEKKEGQQPDYNIVSYGIEMPKAEAQTTHQNDDGFSA